MARERQPHGGVSGIPFDDVRAVLSHFPDPDQACEGLVRDACAALGDLGGLAAWLAGWRGLSLSLNRIQVDMFISMVNAGADDVDEQALHRAQDLLAQVAGGGHPLSQLAQVHGAGLKVYDLALELPTGDVTACPAMEERECAGAMAFGMEGIAGGPDLVVVARAGEGGAIAAAAILGLIYPDLKGQILAEIGETAGALVDRAMETHGSSPSDPFDMLRRLGSRDMAAISGVIMAARTQRIPVVLAGLECLAVAALLERAGAGNTAHCLVGHKGPGIEAELSRRLGILPVLRGDVGREPGVAAGAAIGMMKSAVAAAQPLLHDLEKVNAE